MFNSADLRRIRLIELRTKKLVNESFAGAYHAVFKGRGIAFDSVRAYEPGDDVRDIDWNVTARTGHPHVKRYIEERELTVMLLLDTSASIMFGTVEREKRDLAVELGATLAFAALSNNDKVGLMTFSNEVEHYLPPRKGRNHALRLIRDLLVAKPELSGTNITLALQMINKVLNRHAIIFLISDFLFPSNTYERELMRTSQQHDVIAITLSDPLELRWPDAGLVAVQDAESGQSMWVDSASRRWRREFTHRARQLQMERDAALMRARVDRIDLTVNIDYVKALRMFFQRRASRQ
ncbi:MAG: DUF58 domain-containing protein [Anaerolineae bacterium]|nr:DUF58 domain-containing protein [Anaerolineae bacterium]